MTWFEAYGKEDMPSFAQMDAYVHNPMWSELHAHLQETYNANPRQTYSGCSGQPGWNVKYAKGGKSLCTLYPMDGFFIALVVVGQKEKTEGELQMPTFTPYIQELYQNAGELMGAKWLMISVMDEPVLEDAKRLMAIRRNAK